MKRLRFKYQPKKIRFYMCGEYGELLGRPHYHALLFNHDFMDKTKWTFRQSNVTYRSLALEQLWPFGLSELGNVSFQSAAYVARYVMKKITGAPAAKHYEKIDPKTGEIYNVQPEYNQMSLKPGIGAEWLRKYKTDVYPSDEIITLKGQRIKTPKYYDKLLDKTDPEMLKIIKETRTALGKAYKENSSPERLLAREKCAQAQHSRLKRSL